MGVRKTTSKTYGSAVRSYKYMCTELGYTEFPMTDEKVCVAIYV